MRSALLFLLSLLTVASAPSNGQNSSSEDSKTYEAHVVGLFAASSELPIYHDLIKPTLEMAAEEAERRFPRIKFRVSVRRGVRSCEKNYAGALAAEEFYQRKVDVIIGPACSVALDTVARMAAYWNIPIITAGGIGAEFSNKDLYSSLTRLSFSLGLFNAHPFFWNSRLVSQTNS